MSLNLLYLHLSIKMSSKVLKEVKRSRGTNFSFIEKELMLKYAIENKHILENKESNATSWKEKNECWSKIADHYNSTSTGCVSKYLFYIKFKKFMEVLNIIILYYL